MSRYIEEADFLIHLVKKPRYSSETIGEAIDESHSIDIVRCGGCKYWKESQYYSNVMVCTYVKGATFTRQHDDFCSRGERKDDEQIVEKGDSDTD